MPGGLTAWQSARPSGRDRLLEGWLRIPLDHLGVDDLSRHRASVGQDNGHLAPRLANDDVAFDHRATIDRYLQGRLPTFVFTLYDDIFRHPRVVGEGNGAVDGHQIAIDLGVVDIDATVDGRDVAGDFATAINPDRSVDRRDLAVDGDVLSELNRAVYRAQITIDHDLFGERDRAINGLEPTHSRAGADSDAAVYGAAGAADLATGPDVDCAVDRSPTAIYSLAVRDSDRLVDAAAGKSQKNGACKH